MPIATLVEHTIVPRMTFSFSGKGARAIGSNESRTLPFKHVQSPDYRSAWIGAALGIARYYAAASDRDPILDEKEIEARMKYLDPRKRASSRGDSLEMALRASGHLRRCPLLGPADSNTILAELRDGRPVGVRIAWSSGLPHYVVIYGYRFQDGRVEYIVDDPLHGVIAISDWSLAHSYLCDGRWTHYYLTK